jgi:hypothetical protein
VIYYENITVTIDFSNEIEYNIICCERKGMKKQCKMISFDTSSNDTGYSVFINGNIQTYGDFKTKDKLSTEEKIANMVQMIVQFVKKEKPDIIICEDLNVMKSVKTAKTLSEIIGAVRASSFITGKNVFFDKLPHSHWCSIIAELHKDYTKGKYPPKRVECKKWALDIANRFYSLNTDNDNISDSFLIGIAYITECSQAD